MGVLLLESSKYFLPSSVALNIMCQQSKSTSWQQSAEDVHSDPDKEPLYKRLLNNKKENLERIEKKLKGL